MIESSYRKQVVIDGHACILKVLDTIDQAVYNEIRDERIKDSEGCMLVYSITSRVSFIRIQEYRSLIRNLKERQKLSGHPGSPLITASPSFYGIMLVGNNSDQVTDREVSKQEGRALARNWGVNLWRFQQRTMSTWKRHFSTL